MKCSQPNLPLLYIITSWSWYYSVLTQYIYICVLQKMYFDVRKLHDYLPCIKLIRNGWWVNLNRIQSSNLLWRYVIIIFPRIKICYVGVRESPISWMNSCEISYEFIHEFIGNWMWNWGGKIAINLLAYFCWS